VPDEASEQVAGKRRVLDLVMLVEDSFSVSHKAARTSRGVRPQEASIIVAITAIILVEPML
jgi:hypothetical protein